MELGKRIKEARLAMGLSQRQLCGDEITRNMLSQIENGSARPSMKTLQYLAARLGKSVSFFLEEDALASPNSGCMDAARRLYDGGEFAAARQALETYRGPDQVYDRERELLWVLTHLALAEQALREDRTVYAQELLQKADMSTAYCGEALQRQRLLLLGRIRGQKVSRRLPSLDEELLLRAEEALADGDTVRAVHLLEAMEHPGSPRWNLARGQCALAESRYEAAARYFQAAEAQFPKETAPKLELCYRELGDYRRAYEYACRQK